VLTTELSVAALFAVAEALDAHAAAGLVVIRHLGADGEQPTSRTRRDVTTRLLDAAIEALPEYEAAS
jgi:purine-nucleoside phosphorylase